MTDLSVRRLTSSDAASWQQVRLEALSLYPDAYLTTRDEAEAVPLEIVAERLDAGQTFGAFAGGSLVGISTLVQLTRAQTRHRAEIGAFFVQPASQGQGVASALLDSMATTARKNDVRQLELYVAASNARAIAFYKRAGFREVGQIPNATLSNGRAETDLIMVRELR
ncbi:MAG: N-acetyltransferase [Pseudomonadota bacterium]